MPFSDRLPALQRKLGLEGFVLLAALLGDLLIILPAAFDDVGPRGRDLLLLPGILAMVGCGLWGRRHAVQASFAASAVLIASTAVIRYADVTPYSTLLTDVSLAETVAGLELVFFCVRWARPWFSFTAVSSLVVATLIAIGGRDGVNIGSNRVFETLLIGLVLLIAAVAMGVQFRVRSPMEHTSAATKMFREQWPLIGAMCLPLFLELPQALDKGPPALPLLVCSLVSAVLAVLASRLPVRAGLLLAGVILVSPIGFRAAPRYQMAFDTLPVTVIAAGLVVVVFLIRTVPTRPAWLTIGALSLAVALASAANVRDGSNLTILAIGAILLLGLAVAIGLYFRARDSERAKVVEAAVTEAQTSERMALARELHDVVAHHVTGIVVQAQAAKLMGESNPKLAMEALDRIETAGTEALVAMRRLVRSMRGSSQATEQATMNLEADLRQLIAAAHHGVHTDADLRLPPDIPQEVARSALRLVQESLTNVGKHAAGATRVEVLAEVVETDLHIRVSDDGRAPVGKPVGGSGGYGLVGMRERVELLHGSLTAGPVDGGWLVDAWLPLQGEAE
ncbi:two-component sensor histidine kinase [Amycolatopsis sp. K13G38]|uniref:histidine kinase n=1 Tax=Amycolatopsis acididurans TaxID=2724524 RepID=A0ABX1JHF4_9PSEU|nr:histidine kinase [Amycolatopsis acididurans]NKQ59233.1 two-component sensor histidine kinase [Amycolatopsis acididurans]